MKETYLSPQALEGDFEMAFAGYEPPSILEAAREEATMAIRRRATKKAKEVMAQKPKETPLQKAKREAREAIEARMKARAEELGQGLFISPQRGSTQDYNFINMAGTGFNKMSRCVKKGALLIGTGIQPCPPERYRQFGRFLIHVPSLKKGLVKVAGANKQHKMPVKMVGSNFVQMIMTILDNQILDKGLYNSLSEEEQDYFHKMARLCECDQTLGLGIKFSPSDEADMKQFELLKGTIIAGNNDPQTLKQLKQYIFKFIHTGHISKLMGQSLLCELACLEME